MAKKPASYDDIARALAGVIGENDKEATVSQWLDTGFPPLNNASGARWDAGFPVGRMVEIAGPPSSGKCLTKDTYVLSEHGMLTIEELFEEHGYKATCRSRQEPVVTRLINEYGELEETSHFTWNNRLAVKRIKLKSGRQIEVTANHPIRVMSERGQIVWRRGGKVAVGDRVPVMLETNHFGNNNLSAAEARLLGYLIADGSLNSASRISFSNSDEEVATDFAELMRSILGVEVKTTAKTGTGTVDHFINDTALRERLRTDYGLDLTKAAGKTVPACVRRAPRHAVLAFLQGYFELESHVDADSIEVTSASHRLLLEVQHMLANLGIMCSINSKHAANYPDRSYWRLHISGPDYKTFNVIGFRTSARQAIYRPGLGRFSRSGNVPFLSGVLRDLYDAVATTTRETDDLIGNHLSAREDEVQPGKLLEIIDHFKTRVDANSLPMLDHLISLASRNLHYDTVVMIEDDEAPTFDVTLPRTHSFWSNGIISHNTALATAAMAAAQKAGGVAGFMDHERSFSMLLAPNLGLDVTPGRFIYKTPKTFEESVAIYQLAVKTIREKKLIDPSAPICWVFDSLAAMVPQSILTDSKGKERSAEERNMNDNTALARATSAHFPAIAMISEEYGVCCIFLNQLRTKIGVMFGDPRKTTGGDTPAYYFSQRLWLSSSQIKKGTETIGVSVKGSFVKNKVSRPFTQASWFFMFEPDGTGRFDREKSLIEFLEEGGHLQKGAPGRVVWTDGKQYHRDDLARAIRDANAFDQLVALLPPEYEPPVVAEVPVETDTE